MAAEAERTLEQGNMTDHQGWLYLHEGILKWLYGKAAAMPDDKYHNGWQKPLWVAWGWLMHYERFRRAVEALKQPEYLFSKAAQANLTRLLREESAFMGEGQRFDHIHLPWKEWRRHAIQGKEILTGVPTIKELRSIYTELNKSGTLPEKIKNDLEAFDAVALDHRQVKPDGLQADLGTTTIYTLTSSRTERLENGKWEVSVEKAAFFIHDGFDFNGEQWLGEWICSESYKEKGSAF